MKIIVQNSFCKVEGYVSLDAHDLITQLLTYHNDIESEKGQIFYQMKQAKRFGNKKQYGMCVSRLKQLEAGEYVCLYKQNKCPTGLLNIVLEGLKVLGTTFRLEDLGENPGSTVILRWNNKPFEPRYYQNEMIQAGIKAGRGVFEAAVGSGKSLIMANIIKETSVKSLVIVPSKA